MTPFNKLLVGSILSSFCLLATTSVAPLMAQAPETTTPSSAHSTAALTNTSWKLKSFLENGVQTTPINEITLTFSADGRAGGSTGCNSYGGNYNRQSSTLSFAEIVSTKRACVNESAMKQEAQYVGALQSAQKFEVIGDELRISYGDGGQNRLIFGKKVVASNCVPTSNVTKQ